jgi:hypothetical protein
MAITREQHLELRRMFGNCSASWRSKQAEGMRAVPVTSAERAARRLIKRIEVKRERARTKYSARYESLKAEAREAIYFGQDLAKALRLLKQLKAMSL